MKYYFRALLVSAPIFLAVPTLASADCQADFKALMDAHLKAGPYHSSTVNTVGDKVSKIESDVVLPDRFHLKSGPDETYQESIFTETGAWNYVSKGTWSPISAPMAAKALAVFKTGLSGGFQNITGLVCLGEQPIEGKSLITYGFDNPIASMTSGKSVNYHIKLFEGANHLPAIITADTLVGTLHVTATQHITYDPSITVSPPKLNE